MAKKQLTLAPRLIPVSSKEEYMLTEALGLIDYYHPQLRKSALHFARSANLQKAVEILLRLERKRTEDYQRANAPVLFDLNPEEIPHHEDVVAVTINGTAFDLGTRRDNPKHREGFAGNGSRKLPARRQTGSQDQRENGQSNR